MNQNGLSSYEVQERVKSGFDNKPVKNPSKSLVEIIRDNTFTYFNFVFSVIAVILIVVGSWRDVTFLPIIIANTMIGIFQEWRAKKILDKITLLNSPKSRVMRDGKIRDVYVSELVIDDVIYLKAGDQIPADAMIVEGEAMVNESLLTGEPDEISKKKESELLSGSFIVSGECYAKLIRVGADSYASKLTLQARAIRTKEQSEIIRSLNKIVKLAGIAIIPIGLILFCQQFFFNNASIQSAVQGMTAAVIGMIPEGLFLLASVTLAISAMRLALNKVLIHDMKCIETLARVDVLCVDKTGTITTNKMNVKEIVELDDVGDRLEKFVAVQKNDNATMEALKTFYKSSKLKIKAKVFGFSSKYKYSSALIEGESLVLGAPEFVLKSDFSKYQNQIEKYSKKGYRVLVFGDYSGKLDGGELKGNIRALALLVLENEIRETAPETFRYFTEQDVEIKVISGDNPLTVSEVAKQAGICGAERFVDASTLMSDKDIDEAVNKYTIFGRVNPEQKRKLVRALQKAGHTVAMTGDGVNDILALKDADCSVAMASGSEAAVQAAQIVLLESDFAKMPEVVREGRRVVNNLERSGSLFLVKNVFSIMMAVIAILFSIKYPLFPTQVSLLSLFTIGVPSFLLAQIPNERLIRGNFVKNIIFKALPTGMTNVVLILIMVVFGNVMGINFESLSTACIFILLASGLVFLGRICIPFDKVKMAILVLCISGTVIAATLFRNMFRISYDFSLELIMITIFAGIMTYPIQQLFIWLFENIKEKFSKRLERL